MKRFLIVILIAAVLASALVGCANPTHNGDEGTKATDTDTATATDTDTTTDTDTESASDATEDSSNETAQSDTDESAQSDTDESAQSDTDEATQDEEPEGEETEGEETEAPSFDVKESTAGLKFELNEDKQSYTLVGKGSATATSIVIDGYKGLPVTKIGYMAFDSSTITSLTIGDYVREIDDHAFSFCKKLASVKLGSGLKKIGDCAFRYCTALTTISIPSSVECIKWRAFYSCTALINITLPDTVTTIEAEAFRDTDYYKTKWASMRLYIGNHLIRVNVHFQGDIELQSNTKTIAAKAFDGCTELTGVKVPDSVEIIGSKAFTGCSSLATVEFGKGIKRIGEDIFEKTAFYNNEANWTNGVLYVGNYLISVSEDFEGMLTVPAGTKVIASGAASFCDRLSGVRISDSVVFIGDYAFIDCILLANVTLGKGVEIIGQNAFKGCIKLTSLTVLQPSGWKANGAPIDESELSVKSTAALLFTMIHFDKNWTRA